VRDKGEISENIETLTVLSLKSKIIDKLINLVLDPPIMFQNQAQLEENLSRTMNNLDKVRHSKMEEETDRVFHNTHTKHEPAEEAAPE